MGNNLQYAKQMVTTIKSNNLFSDSHTQTHTHTETNRYLYTQPKRMLLIQNKCLSINEC